MDDDAYGCLGLIVLAIFVVVLIIGGWVWKSYACGARWSDFQSQYGVVSGCQVKVDGRWVPEDRVRQF